MNADELTIKLKRLLEELKNNRDRAAHQYQAGGRGTVKLLTVAWDAVKDEIDRLGQDLALTLRFAYGEVWRFNAVVELYPTFEDLLASKALRITLDRAEKDLAAYMSDKASAL